MSIYQPGDYVKVEFKENTTGESEWMWVRVEHADDAEQIMFSQLDNEPIVTKDLHRGMELAVSYENIRDHKKSVDFGAIHAPARGATFCANLCVTVHTVSLLH